MPSDSAASEVAPPPPDGLIEEERASNDPTDNIRRVLADREVLASQASTARDHPHAHRAILDSYERSGVAPELIAEYQQAIEKQIEVYTELERRFPPHQGVRYVFRRASALRKLPPVAWLIDGVLMADSLAVLSGSEASGKSFVALAWGLCIGTGEPWLGRNVQAGSAAYVVAEGFGSRFMQRIEAWESFTGKCDASVHLLGEAPQLSDTASTNALILAAKMIPDLRVIVIDTLARTFVGGEENSAKDVGVLIANAERLRRSTGATVLLIHHETKKGGTPRGSSALSGAASTMISLDRNQRDLKLTCDKQKDAEEFKPIRLHLTDVVLASGEVSLVVTAAQHGGANMPSGLSSREQSAIDALRSTALTSAEWQRASRVPKGASWNRVRDGLVQRGVVVRDGSGRGATFRTAFDPSEIAIPPPPSIQVDPG